MGKTIIWTDEAWNDLESSAEYIARDSPNYAAAFVLMIINSVDSLETLSERGRNVPELNDSAVREIIKGNYRIIYLIDDNIYILAILHGARNFNSVWEDRVQE